MTTAITASCGTERVGSTTEPARNKSRKLKETHNKYERNKDDQVGEEDEESPAGQLVAADVIAARLERALKMELHIDGSILRWLK